MHLLKYNNNIIIIVFDAELFTIRETVHQLREFLATYHERGHCPIRKVFIFSDS
jgi:hypothetical protein